MSDVTDRMIDRINALQARIDKLERMEGKAIACRVYNDADFTHNSTGNFLAVTFNSERQDTLGMHSIAVGESSKITIALGGWYYIWGNAVFAANSTGVRVIELRIGGSTAIARARDNNPSASYPSAVIVSTIYYLAADAYVEMYAYQNSGGNLAISAVANYSPEMAVMRLP